MLHQQRRCVTLVICCDSRPKSKHDPDTTIIIPIGKQTSQEHDTFRIDRFHDIESGLRANQCQHALQTLPHFNESGERMSLKYE